MQVPVQVQVALFSSLKLDLRAVTGKVMQALQSSRLCELLLGTAGVNAGSTLYTVVLVYVRRRMFMSTGALRP